MQSQGCQLMLLLLTMAMVVFVWICIERQNSFTQLFQHIFSQTHYKHRFTSSQMEGSLCLSNNNDISTLLHKNLDEPFHHINILQGYLFYWIKELFVVSCGMEVHSKSNREAYFRHKLNLMPFNKREILLITCSASHAFWKDLPN
jgi:hypothetical protein